MLKGIDPRITPDLMDVLIRLGHGDEITLADTNYPAHSTADASGAPVVDLPGLDAPEAIGLILTLMPLDGFVPETAWFMEHDGQGAAPDPVHEAVRAVIAPHLPEGAAIGSIERQEFYRRAATTRAIIRCTEKRPFGCFILRTGVV